MLAGLLGGLISTIGSWLAPAATAASTVGAAQDLWNKNIAAPIHGIQSAWNKNVAAPVSEWESQNMGDIRKFGEFQNLYNRMNAQPPKTMAPAGTSLSALIQAYQKPKKKKRNLMEYFNDPWDTKGYRGGVYGG